MMTLYGHGKSRWVKPYWTLKELDVAFEPIVMRPDRIRIDHPDFLKINPFGKVPALKDGDFTLFESSAICTYIADKYPEGGLSPKVGTHSRALYDQWLSAITSDLEQPLWRIFKHSFLYPEEKRSSADIALAKEDFLHLSAAMESRISDYLIDGKFTVADIVLTYTLNWAGGYKLLADRPNLKAYAAKHTARAAYPRELYAK